MAGVRFEGVTKRYGDVQVLRALDLDVRDGELLVVVGPSGCGKSTLLRLLAGLESPDAGTIRIGERVVNDVAPGERDVAMVFQSYALYPHLTVRRNLAFGLEMRGTPKVEREARVAEAARALGLEALLDRKPAALSGGQRQRVAVGRAIVRKPGVFLFDEPLSNLDASLRVQTRAELVALQRRLGTTSLYVTHDQVEAMTMGERVAVLDGGVLQQLAPPQEVYDRPANLFVAGFMGTPAMNRLAASRVDAVALQVAGSRFGVPSGLAAALAESEGAVVLGLRPECVRPAEGSPPNWPTFDAVVDHVERLGSETLIHAHAGSERVVAAAPASHAAAAGDAIALAFDLDGASLFDVASGRRLGP